jgi:hypothetical protein
MEKQVVFFGAGASYGAREPRPPLGKDLHQWVLGYFETKWDELSGWENEWASTGQSENLPRYPKKGNKQNIRSTEGLKSLVSTYLQMNKAIRFSGSCFKQCPPKKSISLFLVRKKITWQKAQFCFNVIPKSFREFVDSQP